MKSYRKFGINRRALVAVVIAASPVAASQSAAKRFEGEMNVVMACDWEFLQPTLVAMHSARARSTGPINFLVFVFLSDDEVDRLNDMRGREHGIIGNTLLSGSKLGIDRNTTVTFVILRRDALRGAASDGRGSVLSLKMRLYGIWAGLYDNPDTCNGEQEGAAQIRAALWGYEHYLWLDSDLLVKGNLRVLYEECLEVGNPIITANFQAIGWTDTVERHCSITGNIGWVPTWLINQDPGRTVPSDPEGKLTVEEGECATCASGGVVFWNLVALKEKLDRKEMWKQRFGDRSKNGYSNAPRWWKRAIRQQISQINEGLQQVDVVRHITGTNDEVGLNRLQIIFHEIIARPDGRYCGVYDTELRPRAEIKLLQNDYVNARMGRIDIPSSGPALRGGKNPHPATYYFSSIWNCRASYVYELAGINVGQDTRIGHMREPTLKCIHEIANGRAKVIHWDGEVKPWEYAPIQYQTSPWLTEERKSNIEIFQTPSAARTRNRWTYGELRKKEAPGRLEMEWQEYRRRLLTNPQDEMARQFQALLQAISIVQTREWRNVCRKIDDDKQRELEEADRRRLRTREAGSRGSQ
jgi:hypothetical protein